MRPDQWDRVQDLLDAVSRLPEHERRAHLDEHCPDAEVRAEVESLLGVAGDGDFLDHRQIAPLLAEAATPGHPEWIDHYRIRRVLGEGGMGVVYEAEQQEPVRRTVAIKLIKLGMDTRRVAARFDTERQALALMNHPNIARVYDAGAAEGGRPYFVMEYVEGVPITRFCDEARLSARERLQLFIQVCEGIQHAHQKGIIHRDIKPSNVLTALQDGAPVPKIIDFGIAKATDRDGTDGTMLTEMGQVVGTVLYMSPEQAAMTGRDIDTRTDVYSLGLLLYELLVGALPFDARESGLALDEACRRIREDDPPRPSTRFHALGDTSDELSRLRGTDSGSFVRQLRGDLDWIVMKALEKDRARRYASASELAADVRRYLAHEPVVARPPSTAYRVGKFVRRHKVGVASAAIIVVALVGGIISTSVATVRAWRAEREATTVADYMVDTFRLADPGQSSGAEVTARQILDDRAARIRDELPDQPGVRGRFMASMGEAYIGLGLYPQALELLEEALPLLRAAYGERHESVYNVLNELGKWSSQTGDYAGAKTYFEQALPLAERIQGRDHANVATILKNLGDANVKLGNLDEARPQLERALVIRESVFGSDSPRIVSVLGSLVRLLSEKDRHEAAVDLARRSLAIRLEQYGAKDPKVAHGHYALARALRLAGRFEEARPSYEAALAVFERAYGPEHNYVADCLFQLARVDAALGAGEQAYALYRRSRAVREQALTADAPALALALDEYARFLEELGRDPEALGIRAKASNLREN